MEIFWVIILIVILVLLLAFAVFLLLYTFFLQILPMAFGGAFFAKSSDEKIKKMILLAGINPGD